MLRKTILFSIKFTRKIKRIILKPIWQIKTRSLFYAFNVQFLDFKTNGLPLVFVAKNAKFKIGRHFRMNNNFSANIIGRQQPCIFMVSGYLEIGNNVGISSLAVVCQKRIYIGNNVRIGGNTVIYDTDFHSLNYKERIVIPEIKENIKSKDVIIRDNVFIGGHTTILKGVNIGSNSIIGAGSVVTKDIPENQIWAGNPAKFIKLI